MIDKIPKWELPGLEVEKIAQQIVWERPMPQHFARMLAVRGIKSIDEAENSQILPWTISGIRFS